MSAPDPRYTPPGDAGETADTLVGTVTYSVAAAVPVGSTVALVSSYYYLGAATNGAWLARWDARDATLVREQREIQETYHPAWAVLTGIIIIVLFVWILVGLVGFALFFVKQTRLVPVYTATIVVQGSQQITVTQRYPWQRAA
ncbi:MAG: hypothetical protein U0990_00725 [Candidatus Nanopelagicales bacterium]|nr:hypothetical protein [Candidatus Nanopelagicales bacterium]MDZ4248599.1 hypothetical protein [Candidatus Nanopelagicales bacterium]